MKNGRRWESLERASRYFIMPCLYLMKAVVMFYCHHEWFALAWAGLLVLWLWQFPWFVVLVVKSLLGIL